MIPKTLIFHDDREKAANAAKFLNSICHESMRKNRIAKHYHSMMSEDYLEEIFQDFSSPQVTTRILCATSGASTVSSVYHAYMFSVISSRYQGLDLPDIATVIQYGVCRDIPNLLHVQLGEKYSA